ncbi:MAG: hypothetical protein ACRC3H_07290 [Lachnospiraceae bacterium]
MARNNTAKPEDWIIRIFGVAFQDGKRIEKPLEKFSASELREIAARKNEEALKAAGYVPAANAPDLKR